MTIRQLRERWAERDCAVGFPGTWWVRFGAKWYLLLEQWGDENVLAASTSPQRMLRRLSGTVLRCSCCGAVYSPRVAVLGYVGGCRTLFVEEDEAVK
jgi:hypothetical protein